MNRKEFYRKKYPNVSRKVFEIVWTRKPWMIEILTSCLNNTKACHTAFFNFLVYKLHDVGEDAARKLLQAGFNLIDFLQEHEKRKRIKATMN